jgi:O-antigen/teichoic acid export membrane protein
MTSAALSLISNSRHLLRRSAFHHVAALTIAQGLAADLGVLTTVVAARILGPEGYGQAALVFAFPSLALSVSSFKSMTVTTRYIASFRATRDKDQLRAVCKLAYAIDLTIFLIVFIIVTLGGRWIAEHVYGAPWSFRPMVLYAASFPLLAFRGGSIATITAFEEFRRLTLVYLLDRGMSFLLVVALLLAGYGTFGMALGMAIGNGLIGLVSLYMATALLVRNGIGP